MKPEKIEALAKIVGEEQANIVAELYKKHNGEIALAIKKGQAFVCRKPKFEEYQIFTGKLKKQETNQTMKEHALDLLLHPDRAAAGAMFTEYLGLAAGLSARANDLIDEDPEFDLEGN